MYLPIECDPGIYLGNWCDPVLNTMDFFFGSLHGQRQVIKFYKFSTKWILGSCMDSIKDCMRCEFEDIGVFSDASQCLFLDEPIPEPEYNIHMGYPKRKNTVKMEGKYSFEPM